MAVLKFSLLLYKDKKNYRFHLQRSSSAISLLGLSEDERPSTDRLRDKKALTLSNTTVHHLQQRIRQCCEAIQPDVLLRVHADWQMRLAVCLAQEGQHIEHVL